MMLCYYYFCKSSKYYYGVQQIMLNFILLLSM